MFEDDFIRKAGGTIIPPNSNLQVFGDHRRGHFKVGYSLYIGNGTTPDDIAQANRDNLNFDVNDNKGTGFRLALDPTDNLGGGLSLYSEKGVFNVVPQMQLRADTDGDGVPDSSDACPNEEGSPTNGGCPFPPSIGGIVGLGVGSDDSPAGHQNGQGHELEMAALAVALAAAAGVSWQYRRRVG